MYGQIYQWPVPQLTTAAMHLPAINSVKDTSPVTSPHAPCVYVCIGTLNLRDIQPVSEWQSVQYTICVLGTEYSFI